MTKTTSVTHGLDVGDRHIHSCGLDDEGHVVLRTRIETRQLAVQRTFGKLPGSLVALELGRHSPWLSRALAALGHDVVVTNPRMVRLIMDTDKKKDRLDAEKLARLARVDRALLHPIQHRREDTQAARAFLRSREVVVAQRTQAINSVRAQVLAFGGRLPAGHVTTFHKLLDQVPEPLRDALAPRPACSRSNRDRPGLRMEAGRVGETIRDAAAAVSVQRDRRRVASIGPPGHQQRSMALGAVLVQRGQLDLERLVELLVTVSTGKRVQPTVAPAPPASGLLGSGQLPLDLPANQLLPWHGPSRALPDHETAAESIPDYLIGALVVADQPASPA